MSAGAPTTVVDSLPSAKVKLKEFEMENVSGHSQRKMLAHTQRRTICPLVQIYFHFNNVFILYFSFFFSSSTFSLKCVYSLLLRNITCVRRLRRRLNRNVCYHLEFSLVYFFFVFLSVFLVQNGSMQLKKSQHIFTLNVLLLFLSRFFRVPFKWMTWSCQCSCS